MSEHKRILVLGGSSFVGRHLRQHWQARPYLATFNANAFEGGVRFDSVSMRLSDAVGDLTAYSHAVMLLGDTQPDSCIADPARSQAVNVDSLKVVIDDLIAAHVHIVFTSSEFVFDGNAGNYTEEDIAAPTLLYGQQKLAVEEYLRSKTENWAIIRLAKIYGVSPGDGTLFSGMWQVLQSGGEIKCATDQRFSPVYVGDVVLALEHAVERPLQGLYHVAGPIGDSRMAFLNTMIDVAGADITVKSCSIHDFELPERRPEDVTMSPAKLVADTGLRLLSPEEACRRIHAAAEKMM